jgi:epoxyqueuosine reductase
VTSAEIKAKARELGFDACGIAPAADLPELGFLSEWLARGYGASMGWLHRSAERRREVRRVLPSARTVVCTATVYNTPRPYSTECAEPGRAHVSRYAWGDDYHEVVASRLEALLAWMRETAGPPFEARVYVDTGPVQERVFARHAGIGWIGKNTCVINPELGSWIFLGEILCSLPLELDRPAFDQCGTCTLCLEACPTGALVGPGVLDSNRCISYHTIEHRGAIDPALTERMRTHIYGCDVCQEVCPWNAIAPVSEDPAWQPRPAWDARSVVDLLQLIERGGEEREKALRRSPMKRAKVEGLKRNLQIAMGNAQRD